MYYNYVLLCFDRKRGRRKFYTGLTEDLRQRVSQHKNKDIGMRILRTQLYKLYNSQKKAERDEARRTQIGSGDRSEKIRTYNFSQNRVTDHRIDYTSHNLDGFLLGELDELIQKLIESERTEKLKQLSSSK